jgi:pimeloyl-ACP methyl ester carboxylesterase
MKKTTRKILILIPSVVFLALVLAYFLFPGVLFTALVRVERGIAGLERLRIQVGDWRIEYLEGGRGDALVLLHGFGANKDNWTRIGRYLTPHFRVIAPDLPGFGESTQTPGADYTIAAQAERINGLVRTLGLKSFHLGGNSMGGSIAGAYAARRPETLKSLWLLAPGGVRSAEPSDMYRILETGGPNPLIAKSVQDYERLLDFVFHRRPFIPRAIKRRLVKEAMDHRSLNQAIFQQLRESRKIAAMEELLQGLTIPTLILWGAQDRVLHPSGAGVLKSVIPGAKSVIMEETGHLPMVEKPEEAAKHYIDFLGIRH